MLICTWKIQQETCCIPEFSRLNDMYAGSRERLWSGFTCVLRGKESRKAVPRIQTVSGKNLKIALPVLNVSKSYKLYIEQHSLLQLIWITSVLTYLVYTQQDFHLSLQDKWPVLEICHFQICIFNKSTEKHTRWDANFLICWGGVY